MREAKARREMASVVFWERRVVTSPSRTVGGGGGGESPLPPRRRRRKGANSSGKPWNPSSASRTARHCAGEGEAWVG